MINFNFKKETDEDKKIREREEFVERIKTAHREWLEEEEFFRSVTDPDLIDYAIYQAEAARLKYIYLLKKIRKEEFKIEEEADNSSLTHG